MLQIKEQCVLAFERLMWQVPPSPVPPKGKPESTTPALYLELQQLYCLFLNVKWQPSFRKHLSQTRR